MARLLWFAAVSVSLLFLTQSIEPLSYGENEMFPVGDAPPHMYPGDIDIFLTDVSPARFDEIDALLGVARWPGTPNYLKLFLIR